MSFCFDYEERAEFVGVVIRMAFAVAFGTVKLALGDSCHTKVDLL